MKMLLQKRTRFFSLVFILVILVGGGTMPAQAQGQTPQSLPDLLSPVDEAAPMGAVMDATGEVIRNRGTQVNTGLVVQLARSGGQQIGDGQPDFAFNLFVDVAYPAYVRGVEEMDNGAVGLYGVLSDNPVSEFVLVAQNGVVSAYLQDGINTYEIRYQNGGHVIVEVDSSVYPDSLPPLPVPEEVSGPMIQADAVAVPDSAAVIDVLGLYTPRARDAEGGVDAIEARIEASIISANLGYANSGVTPRLRLVGIEEVVYDEIIPGMSDIEMWYYALSRLAFGRYGTDLATANYLADARSYREAYGADMVFMITELPLAACGLGYLGGDAGDSEVAYSIVHRICSGSTAYSVQHEMGHNMGACHDRANTDDTTKNNYCYSSEYSFGYWLPNDLYYTVMAYPCPTCIGRINYWSNPNVSYGGVPTGVAVGSADAAYNVLTLNNTAAAVANYRKAVTIEASFVPAWAYDRLQYPRTRLDLQASSPSGDIIQVMYQAYYDGTWHTLQIDSTPSDGWAYNWNTVAVGEKMISLRATVWDSVGNSRTITLNNVQLALGTSTSAGFTARQALRGEIESNFGFSSDVVQFDTDGVLGLEPIPVNASKIEEIMAQYWEGSEKLPPEKLPSVRIMGFLK